MPYAIHKKGDQWCVYEKATGKSRGCSDSQEMAQRHIAAMYANEKSLGEAHLERRQPHCFEAVKTVDGRIRVFMRVSNRYKDRHGEIITEAAHKEYEQYVAESGDYPEFWLWHKSYSKWGKADLVSYDDGFLTVSGLADWGKEYIAEGLASISSELGVSHGFKYISLEGQGQLDWYRMKEASPLPRSEAANIWTSYLSLKEEGKGMALQDKHKKFFESVGVPASVISEWDQSNKDIDGLLKAAGIEYKEVGTSDSGTASPGTGGSGSGDTAGAATVEATLADGTKIQVPATAVVKQADPMEGAPTWAKALMSKYQGIEAKQKELEAGLKGLASSGTDSWEAAIQQGKGYVASKEGSAPSGQEASDQKEWEKQLAALLTEGNV